MRDTGYWVQDAGYRIGYRLSDCAREIEISPDERKSISLNIAPAGAQADEATVRVVGDFKMTGRAVLGLRFVRTRSQPGE